MIDLAVKGVGKHGEGLVQGEDVGPVDLLGPQVKLLRRGALELDQRRQHARDQPRAVVDAVQGLQIGLEVDAAGEDLAVGGPQRLQLLGRDILQAAGHLGEELVEALVVKHQASSRTIRM